MKFLFIIIICLATGLNSFLMATRSLFRKKDEKIPTILTYWDNNHDDKQYILQNWYIREKPVFKQYDEQHIKKNLLPSDGITYRNSETQIVLGQLLKDLLDQLIQEIYNKEQTLTNFNILKKSDFNSNTNSGILILKFKDYPFVAKIFMETPQTFVKPFSKGWGPSSLFYMAGGISRYLSGFSRIKNLHNVQKKVKSDHYWSKIIDFPRKWFYIPSNINWFHVDGKNIGIKPQHIKLPSIYIIIADAIENDNQFSLFNAEQRQMALDFARFANNCIDPHIDNFIKDKKTDKMIIIDTEYFPIMVGIDNHSFKYDGYGSWIFKLGIKYIHDKFFHNKKYHLDQQQLNPYHIVEEN